MPDWTSLLWYLGLLLIQLCFMLHILHSKRDEPSEAMFWLMVTWLIPAGGMICYLFFGITRQRKVNFIIRELRAQLSGEQERQLGTDYDRFERKLKEFDLRGEAAAKAHNRTFDRLFPDSRPLLGNHIEMLKDGGAVYPRMLEDIRGARTSIRLQSFIFMSDEVGRKILAALEEKATEGVDVKVLFDSIGSLKSYFDPFFLRCLFRKQPHFTIQAFSPINLLAPWKFQLRNHRKLLVIDGHVAYTGGVNISEENERLEKVPANRHIHDLHCRITGPAVSQFAMSFLRDWAYTTRRHPGTWTLAEEFPPPAATGEEAIRVMESGPGSNYQGTKRLFFSAAALARQSLSIMTPYLVPGAEFVDALCLAAARGVEVNVIVPANNNHFLVACAARNAYEKLLRSGVNIYEKEGLFSHIKALLVDCEWGFMGSSNCDSRSFRLNFELDFVFERGEFVRTLQEEFQAELAESHKIELTAMEKRSGAARLGDSICALFSPLL